MTKYHPYGVKLSSGQKRETSESVSKQFSDNRPFNQKRTTWS